MIITSFRKFVYCFLGVSIYERGAHSSKAEILPEQALKKKLHRITSYGPSGANGQGPELELMKAYTQKPIKSIGIVDKSLCFFIPTVRRPVGYRRSICAFKNKLSCMRRLKRE